MAVLAALLESALVHHLVRQGRDTLALLLDQIFRVLLPGLMYPLCMLGLVLGAFTESVAVTVSLVVCGIVLPMAGGAMRVRHVLARFEAAKRRLARALVEADATKIDDQSDSPLLREAFDHFDLDKSGDIDADEVRSLLGYMYPLMPKPHRKAALKLLLAQSAGHRIIFEDFDDIILEWRQYAQQNDPKGEWLERKAAQVFASSAMQFLPSSLRRQSTLDDLKREASAGSSSAV